MLKLAAIVPHPLPLIPSIGKANIALLAKTANLYKKLADALLAEKIDSIVILTSHGSKNPEFFSINMADEYEVNFEEFGDFSAKMKVRGDLELAQNIREALAENTSVKAAHEPILDHGCGVPFFTLGENLKKIAAVPINVSAASLEKHFELGKKIGETIGAEKKKVAIIASSDLSPRLEKKSPAGFSPRAAKFDQRLVELVSQKKTEEILGLDEKLIEEANPCGLKAIAALSGALSGRDYEVQNFVYEAPFGIGYLSAIMEIVPAAK